jgi:chemotaxis protein MotB
MNPKYLQNTADRHDRWMVSYADVLTIILIFFLVAAARSLAVPPTRVVVPPSPPATAAPPAEAEKPRPILLRAEERLKERGLEAHLEARGLVVSLPQVVLFPAGADNVSPGALPALARIAEVLRDIPNDVQLIGHADTVPIHNRRFHSNWDLSMARSQKILALLSVRYGISESRLSIASYGPYRPAAPNDSVDGRASNRRVEIVILGESQAETSRAAPNLPKPGTAIEDRSE